MPEPEPELMKCGTDYHEARDEPLRPIRNPQIDPRCPDVEPTLNDDCNVPEDVSCVYTLIDCCGEMIPSTYYECDGQWYAIAVDMDCDLGKYSTSNIISKSFFVFQIAKTY